MLTAARIKELFRALNSELGGMGVKGEIGICGGAVMCLVFKARASTKDVDGIFAPTHEMRKASIRVARKFGITAGWLNDAAKAYFLQDLPRMTVLELSNLRVWAPTAEYMLAMKCVSARFDTHDRGDVEFLILHLHLRAPEEVFSIIEKFYPRKQIPPKTQFLVEELFETVKSPIGCGRSRRGPRSRSL